MSSPRVRIALDLLGADHAPDILLASLRDIPPTQIELVGVGPASLRELLPDKFGPASGRAAEIVATSEFISQDDSLSTALRRKPDASMRVALNLLRTGRVDAVVSAGNTAALMAIGRQLLPRAAGLSRPAICKQLNGKQQPVWLLDLGANIDVDAVTLAQFALLGVALAGGPDGANAGKDVRVGLLNIGAEVSKGPAVLGQAAELLDADSRYRYVGFVEAHELFDGRADVVVSDGLLGNVALKAIEGTASMAQHLLEAHIARQLKRGGLRARALRWLLAARDLADVYDPQGYNGASLLGLSGVVIKSHGRADGTGYAAAIMQAHQEFVSEVPRRVFAAFEMSGAAQS